MKEFQKYVPIILPKTIIKHLIVMALLFNQRAHGPVHNFAAPAVCW